MDFELKTYDVEFNVTFGVDEGCGEGMHPHLDSQGNLIIDIEGDLALDGEGSYRVSKDNVPAFLKEYNEWVEDYNKTYGFSDKKTWEENYVEYEEIILKKPDNPSDEDDDEDDVIDIESFDELVTDCLSDITAITQDGDGYDDNEDDDFDEDEEDFVDDTEDED